MGLDMYLSRKSYVGNQYRNESEQVKIILPESQKDVLFPIKSINQNKVSYIIEEVGYWRKANQIHTWFVENIQDGEDDCGEYEVSSEKLEELLSICKKIKESTVLKDGVIKNGETLLNHVWVPIVEEGKEMEDSSLAEMLLPASSGFFFGSTDYDQYYMEDIDNTIKIIEDLKGADGNIEGTILYSSSW